MLSATTLKDEETFAFDPASNLLDPKAPRRPIHHPPPKLLDNLLRDYVGQHYTYDARGNLLERLDNGKKARFTWDLYDRLTRYEDDRLTADFAYDALGRRVAKYSKAHCPPSPGAGPAWIEQQLRTLNAQYDCGQNIYGWDGDTLAYETRYSDNPGERRLIHYFYEPGSFIPVAQTVQNRNLSLVREPSHENGYHIDRDPLWQHQPVAKPFNAMAWYQCDHLGTPMELTDQRGEIAWSGTYQAWGLAKEKRTDSAIRENIRNPLRFQGQYFDTETGLHYNHYRYYDPQVGRFISKDPIGFAGGLNVYAYAPNPVGWVDPFGLAKLTHAPDFDTARVQALKNAGMTNPENVTLSKYDPVTGTVVEFKGEGGAKVAYDAPHADMDPKTGHDKPHIGWQTSGKRGRCGCAERGNITYDGPQHPHRPDKK